MFWIGTKRESNFNWGFHRNRGLACIDTGFLPFALGILLKVILWICLVLYLFDLWSYGLPSGYLYAFSWLVMYHKSKSIKVLKNLTFQGKWNNTICIYIYLLHLTFVVVHWKTHFKRGEKKCKCFSQGISVQLFDEEKVLKSFKSFLEGTCYSKHWPIITLSVTELWLLVMQKEDYHSNDCKNCFIM